MSAYKIPNRGVADLHSPTNGMAVGSQKLVVLPDSAWQTSFPDSWDFFSVPVKVSIYCPTFIKICNILGAEIIPFKHFYMLATCDDFTNAVQHAGKSLLKALLCFKFPWSWGSCKTSPKALNKRIFGDIPVKFAYANQLLLQAQKLLHENHLDGGLVKTEHAASKKHYTWQKRTEIFYVRKSKADCINLWKQNNIFFHTALKQRHYRSRVSSIMNDHGVLIEDYADLVAHFVNF